ncbi:acylphosphatase [Corynebacterium sp. TAE3-ERU12]|uniref:acylphosphatase n=1 Tax=Corynebacterium sp. TAE3-ERU12 TaxID=2849491 RepID=UPI001C47D2BC|nr:acylphosphatase [Corynebacterium sp. TAE3-ERU12]MBV7295201.1 acylphosphatase [Corynebacterium sp. TAE3-ERU12]
MDDSVRLTAWVHGHVQGVGFRWAARSAALERGLVGYAKNYPDGRVLVIAEGAKDRAEDLLKWLRGPNTPGTVATVVSDFGEARGQYTDFQRR